MSNGEALVYAYVLDGKGGGIAVDWKAIDDWNPNQGLLWIHLFRTKFLNYLPPVYEVGDVIQSILIGRHCGLQFIDDRVVRTQHLLCFRQ